MPIGRFSRAPPRAAVAAWRVLAAGAVFGLVAWGSSASAQQAVDPQRDCQTVVQCKFTKGGVYRGCISAYSCRVCRFVPARCQTGPDGRARVCQKLRCTWG